VYSEHDTAAFAEDRLRRPGRERQEVEAQAISVTLRASGAVHQKLTAEIQEKHHGDGDADFPRYPRLARPVERARDDDCDQRVRRRHAQPAADQAGSGEMANQAVL